MGKQSRINYNYSCPERQAGNKGKTWRTLRTVEVKMFLPLFFWWRKPVARMWFCDLYFAQICSCEDVAIQVATLTSWQFYSFCCSFRKVSSFPYSSLDKYEGIKCLRRKSSWEHHDGSRQRKFEFLLTFEHKTIKTHLS